MAFEGSDPVRSTIVINNNNNNNNNNTIGKINTVSYF